MDASPQLSEPHDTPEQDRRIARIDLIFGTVASVIGFAWLVTRGMESLEWAAPYLLVVFWLAMLIGGAFAVWVNRSKIQRAIEESDFL